MYKNCDPTPTHQRVFARQLQRLQAAHIPIVLVVGNHDAPGAFGKATSVDIFSTLQLEDTHVIRRPKLLRIETANGLVQVAGLPWPTRHALLTRDEYRDLSIEEIRGEIQKIYADQIDEYARQLDPKLPGVLVAHLAAADAVYSGGERTPPSSAKTPFGSPVLLPTPPTITSPWGTFTNIKTSIPANTRPWSIRVA